MIRVLFETTVVAAEADKLVQLWKFSSTRSCSDCANNPYTIENKKVIEIINFFITFIVFKMMLQK